VSGDFYWFYVDGKTLYYITADSTGHGVPGGFMSMLGINLLSEIVIERKVKDPGTILNMLREEIIRSLKTDEGYSMDGMDATYFVKLIRRQKYWNMLLQIILYISFVSKNCRNTNLKKCL
jgi:hypothetical protein